MTIKATIIADSINAKGVRLTTFEFEYPRFIHAEVMTHRMLSKNAASSRAIPIKAMHETIRKDPAMPIYWGKNQAGMQAKEELNEAELQNVQKYWKWAMVDALDWSRMMDTQGLHKQIANRVTEPFQTMKTIISGTEWTNFFWLRNHPDAQPEFQRLAESAQAAMNISKPELLQPDEWHLPYIKFYRDGSGVLHYIDNEGFTLTMEDARIISASCCAQVSYRKSDDSFQKALAIFDRLVNTSPVHASPVEHQATPMRDGTAFGDWPDGMTHIKKNGSRWSGNFQEFVQFRQLIPNNSVW